MIRLPGISLGPLPGGEKFCFTTQIMTDSSWDLRHLISVSAPMSSCAVCVAFQKTRRHTVGATFCSCQDSLHMRMRTPAQPPVWKFSYREITEGVGTMIVDL